MLYDELPIGLTFYDRKEKQNRFKPNVITDEGQSELKVPSTKLLPWQFKTATSNSVPAFWYVYDLEDNQIVSLKVTNIKKGTLDSLDYIYYKANSALVDINDDPVDLGCGLFYCVVITNGKTYYSEVFQSVTGLETNKDYLLLEYSNQTPISPVWYGDGYVNRLYFKTFITTGEQVLTNETEKDGIDNDIIITQKLTESYEIALGLLPQFLQRAISFLTINSSVTILEIFSGRFGNIYNMRLRTNPEAGKSINNTDLIFTQNQVIFRNTCDGVINPDLGENDDPNVLTYDGIIDDGENNDNINYEDI